MSEQAIFKKQTFGGFNKNEVLSYIDKLNSDYSSEIESMKNDYDEINNALNEKNSLLTEKENCFNELLSTYEELRQHYLMLKERSDNLEYENNKLKEINQDLLKKVEEEKEDIKRLKSTDSVISLDQIGENAKSIVLSAKDGAHEIISDAQKSVSGINFEMDDFKNEISNTKKSIEDSLTMLLSKVDSLSKHIDIGNDSEKKTKYENIIQEKYDKAISGINSKIRTVKDSFFQ